jgi:hypothetical protein
MSAGVEVDFAEGCIDACHEVGRCEAAVPILLVTLAPIGSLGRTPPCLARERRQQAQEAGDLFRSLAGSTPLRTIVNSSKARWRAWSAVQGEPCFPIVTLRCGASRPPIR